MQGGRGFLFSWLRAQGDEPLRPPAAGISPFRGGFAGCVSD